MTGLAKADFESAARESAFLPVARYCDQLWIESVSCRDYSLNLPLEDASGAYNVQDWLGVPIPLSELAPRVAIQVSNHTGRKRILTAGRDFTWDERKLKLSFLGRIESVNVTLNIVCSDLKFKACLDFGRLLKMADNADLEELDDFTSIEIVPIDESDVQGTEIRVEALKPFIRRELRSERRKGFVRNVASMSGLENFKWQLSRCTPISYAPAPENQNPVVAESLSQGPKSLLGSLIVRHGDEEGTLRRPIYPYQNDAPTIPPDMLVPVAINEKGLRVRGFLAGYESVIFPAEFRGIAIRVRGVAIGEPGFLGAEHLLTGANKAALSQITGELNVLAGLDAADTLNPGRESFYEESEHFQIIRKHLLGEGEQITGHLGTTIAAVLTRSQVRTALGDVLGCAAIRRRALEDISAAITHLIAQADTNAAAIRKMLRSRRSTLNGLSAAKEHELELPPRIGGLPVVRSNSLTEPAEVDYVSQQVRLDMSRSDWDWSLLLFDRRFQILHRRGNPDQPIAEMDLKDGRIFVNWGHPVKLQMDERGFIRTALAWILAKEAACLDSFSNDGFGLEAAFLHDEYQWLSRFPPRLC